MGQTLAKRQQEKFRKDNKIIGFLGDEYPIESYFTKLSITTSKGKWNPAETETITVPTNDTTKYDGNLMSGKQDLHSSGFAVYTLKAEKEITTSVLEEIESLCNNNNKDSSNKILLIGEPGIGKSTLVRFICYQWSMGRLWNQKFNHIWFIELKELVDWLLDASNDGFLMNDVKENKKLIIRPFHSKAEKYANFIYYIEKKKLKGIIPNIRKEEIAKRILLKKELFLFDGYDEISVNLIQFQQKLQNDLTIMIDPWKEAKELIDTFSNYIVTSRPNAIYEQKIQEKIPFDKTLINLGFSQEGRLEYVKRYFSTKQITPELREQLITTILQFIEEVEMIKEICRIPLNVEIICYLWYDDYYRKKLKQQEFNLTILYSLMEMKLADWYKYKNEGNKMVTTELKEFLQRLSFLSLFRNQIRGVNEATIQELLTEKFADGKSNDNRNHHQLEEFLKDVGNLGFIHPVYPSWPTRKQDHYFNHKTFQEYFSAQFIIEMLSSPVPNISQTLQNFDLRNFIIENCFNPYYLQTFKFVCGLLSVHQEVYSKEEENRNKMQEFLRVILEATVKQDATGRKQFVLLLHLFSQISSSVMKNFAKKREGGRRGNYTLSDAEHLSAFLFLWTYLL